jgi:hypothetical protein
MTNGEKFKEIFSVTQVDDCDLNVYAWLPNHDAIEIPLEWWNAEYKESKMIIEKINCKTTKCENCKNHNYCDYEPQESEDKE